MNKAFTLPELIIGMVVAVLVGGLLLSLTVSSTGLFYQQRSKVSQGLGSNDALSQIRSLVKQAQSVAVQYPETGAANYTSRADSMVLKLPAIDSSGNIISSTFDFAVYLKTDDKLWGKIFPTSPSIRKSQNQILSANVESILFQYFDSQNTQVVPSSAVKVKITLRQNTTVGNIEETNVATTEANLRNN